MTAQQLETCSMELVEARHRVSQAVRSDLSAAGFLEVTTPLVTPFPEICPNPQFVTEHPNSRQRGYLRVAPTEFLKRLLVCGATRIFEFSTNVRSENVDPTHLPEFSSLEAMSVNSSAIDMALLTERLVRLALRIAGHAENRRYTPPGSTRMYDLAAPWPRLSLPDILADRFDTSRDDLFNPHSVAEIALALGAKIDVASTDLPTMADEIVTALAKTYDTPVFIGEYPRYLGGPAKPAPDARFKERLELFVGSLEMANMSSTMTDASLLRAWHTEMYQLKQTKGVSTNAIDEPLLASVQLGLPDSAVLGMGLERLLMVAFDVPDIRQVRMFNWGELFINSNEVKRHE